MSDGQTHGEKLGQARPADVVRRTTSVDAEEEDAAFARMTDDFFKARNPFLAKHREAIAAFGDTTFQAAELKAKVDGLRRDLERTVSDLERAHIRVDLARKDVEHAMGDLLDHQDKRPKRGRPQCAGCGLLRGPAHPHEPSVEWREGLMAVLCNDCAAQRAKKLGSS